MLHQRFFIGALTAVLLLAGCSTIDPYTREKEMSKASKQAIYGAAAGVVAGVISGDDSRERRKRALIGAGVGALAGGAVGAYMDRQEAKLRAQLEGTGVSVTRLEDRIILNMPGNVTFDTNRAEVKSQFYPVLDSVALVLKEYDKTLVEIAGHTDSTGTVAINQPLSERRAGSVGDYLRSQGINPTRIATFGLAADYPVASNSTPEGRSLNRRVEITLVPLTA